MKDRIIEYLLNNIDTLKEELIITKSDRDMASHNYSSVCSQYTKLRDEFEKEKQDRKEDCEICPFTVYEKRYDELKHEFENFKNAYKGLQNSHIALEKKLREKQIELDLDTPEGYYASLEAVPFVEGKENFYAYYNHYLKQYKCSSFINDNYTITGFKNISKADAEAFCEKFNK